MVGWTCMWCSLVPRPPPFFVLRFAFSIIHGSRRVRKTGKAWEHLYITWMTSGGHKVDVGGAVPDYKYRRNKPETEFLTCQAEYSWSCERLGFCLVVERSMMKSSTLFQYSSADPSPPHVHLASTRHNLRSRCSQAFPVFHHSSTSMYYTEHKLKNKKTGDAWGRGYMWWPVDTWLTCFLTSFHNCGGKLVKDLGSLLCHRPEMVDSIGM